MGGSAGRGRAAGVRARRGRPGRLPPRAASGRPPSAATLDRLAYRFIAFGFPIWTFGVICGADLGAERVGPLLGLGPQGDVVVHHVDDLRGLPARARDLRVEGDAGRRDRPGRVRLAVRHVLRGEHVDRGAALLRDVTSPPGAAGGGPMVQCRRSAPPRGRASPPGRTRDVRRKLLVGARARGAWRCCWRRALRADARARSTPSRARSPEAEATCSSPCLLGGGGRLRAGRGRDRPDRDPVPPPQGSGAHAAADPREHAARDRVDDRAGARAGVRDGPHDRA